ncbi:MAG TPA: D-aminoacylase [Chitinophagaceae bacterium]|jgi:N-acyl-D-amino-acid deacylase|nr:D-aminoacylase [Chitinophagaceae bacterium]
MRKLFLVFLPAFLFFSKQKIEYDTIIRHAQVCDGSGGRPFSADIGIIADTIAFIGDLEHASAKNEIDAHSLILAPGFIDTHSHHAGELFQHRDVLAAVSQGLTTIIIGQDGESRFPLATFFQQLLDTPVAINIGSYCGHNTIRDSVLGKDFKRLASKEEIEKMKLLLRQDMETGAFGLSTGLEYDPGIYSSPDEVLQLAKEVAPYRGRYISHIRSEDRYFWKAIDEIINIGKATKIPVQISHIKLAMHNLWEKSDSLLLLLDNARKSGINITSDIYPYAFWHSTIRVLFPDRNFSDEKEAEMILKEITLPQDIILSSYEIQPEYEGKSLATIAALENKAPARMLTELIARIEKFERENKRACDEGILATSMDENDIKKLMNWTQANICSDGSSFGGHPRGYGAFTKVLGHYAREERIFTIQEAIHKMTGLSAEHMGIKRRGLIKKGYYADLVLFDPAKVSDRATVAEPHKISEGIEVVWVNGKQVFKNGKTTGAFPGTIIRRQ